MVQSIRRLAVLTALAALGALIITILRRLGSKGRGAGIDEARQPGSPLGTGEAPVPTVAPEPTRTTAATEAPKPETSSMTAEPMTPASPADTTIPDTAAEPTTSEPRADSAAAAAPTAGIPVVAAPVAPAQPTGSNGSTGDAVAAWVAADDGVCPTSHPVKVKEASGIFHVPGGANHQRTRADRCYLSAEAAEADGYRAAKR